MSYLALRGLAKTYGPVQALTKADLDVDKGLLVCLLGPSGCGKTTLLRLIAGLERPSRGHVLLDGRDLTAMPAHRRNFGMVFQSLALFPHLSITDNVGYALKIRGVAARERQRRVDELLQLVRLPGVGGRRINQLSGGQRQRVAIARALAIDPAVFLLDEPLSALDAKLRELMQVELRKLQQRLGVTTIVVTHDQREAMTMADRVVVMSHGEIQQVGSPLELYRRPANAFVAGFLGASNLFAGTVTGDTGVRLDQHDVTLTTEKHGFPVGQAVTVAVRPEDTHLGRCGDHAGNALTGNIAFIRDLGANVEVTVDCDGAEVLAVMTPKERPASAVGDTVTVTLPPAACVVMPR